MGPALYEFRRAKTGKFYDKKINFKIGEVYHASLDCPSAEKFYVKSGEVLGLGESADCYRVKGDLDKAATILSQNSSDELAPYAARVGLALGKVDDAITTMEKFWGSRRDSASYDLLLVALAAKDVDLAVRRHREEKIDSDVGKRLSTISKVASRDSKDLLFAELLAAQELPDIAVVVAKKVVSRNKDYRDARLVLARAYYLVGRSDEAIKEAQKAVELDPIYRPSYLLLAEIYEKIGRTDEAKKMRQKAELFVIGL